VNVILLDHFYSSFDFVVSTLGHLLSYKVIISILVLILLSQR